MAHTDSNETVGGAEQTLPERALHRNFSGRRASAGHRLRRAGERELAASDGARARVRYAYRETRRCLHAHALRNDEPSDLFAVRSLLTPAGLQGLRRQDHQARSARMTSRAEKEMVDSQC